MAPRRGAGPRGLEAVLRRAPSVEGPARPRDTGQLQDRAGADNRVDDTGAHVSFLVLDDDDAGKPVGTVRFVPKKGKLTRLAVLKEYRQYGLGRLLVEALEGHVTAGGDDVRHLVHDGAEGPVVTVKIHSQVRPRLGTGAGGREANAHARSPSRAFTPSSGTPRRGTSLTRTARRTSS